MAAFFDAGLIDEVYLTMIPKSIGGGIRLFPASFDETQWKVSTVKDYGNGVVQLFYRNSVTFGNKMAD